MRPEEEARKIAVYAEIWEEAEPLVTAKLSVNPRIAGCGARAADERDEPFPPMETLRNPASREPIHERTRVQGGRVSRLEASLDREQVSNTTRIAKRLAQAAC
jgi:hypothetical protein